ncbi:hypothetical protein UK12_16050 [Saccharothrix sp. ST-888]|nr:hypothetical protein UK12_16050 [Saccharothrix sp. ST-888]
MVQTPLAKRVWPVIHQPSVARNFTTGTMFSILVSRLPSLPGGLHDGLAQHLARRVDRDVDPAEPVLRGREQALDVGDFGQVALDREALAPGGPDRRDRRVGVGLRDRRVVVHGDLRAVRRHRAADQPAEVLRARADQHDLAHQ